MLVNVMGIFRLFIWNFNSPDPDICGRAKEAALYLCHDVATVAKHIIRQPGPIIRQPGGPIIFVNICLL